MKITIIKYSKPNLYYSNDNYFAGQLVFHDKVELNRQLLDSFPIFKEEWQQEDEVDILKTGYFDMKLALSMSERSDLGKSIYDFFEKCDPLIINYKYIIVVWTGNIARTYAGVIDINTLHADLTISEKQYYIFYSVTGIEKEFVEWMKQIQIEPMINNMDFEGDYLPNWHFRFINPPGLELVQLQSTLNINENIFHTLTIDRITQNKFIENNPGYSVWDGFKSFLIGYAFRFKLLFRTVDSNYPRFIFKLFFRTNALNITHVDNITKIDKSLSYTISKNLFLAYQHRTDEQNSDIERYKGFIMNRNNIFYSTQTEDIKYYTKGKYYRINDVIINDVLVQTINLELHDADLAAGEVAYCNLLYAGDIQYVMQYISNTQLGYLLTGLKARRKLKVKVAEDSNMIVGSSAEIDNRNYVLERINSYDNFKQEMETEWIEQ